MTRPVIFIQYHFRGSRVNHLFYNITLLQAKLKNKQGGQHISTVVEIITKEWIGNKKNCNSTLHLTIQFSLWHFNVSHTICEDGKFASASTGQLSCPSACWFWANISTSGSCETALATTASRAGSGLSHHPFPHSPALRTHMSHQRMNSHSLPFPSPALGVPELENSFSFKIISLVSLLQYHQNPWKLLQSHIQPQMRNTCCHSDSSKFCSCHQQ